MRNCCVERKDKIQSVLISLYISIPLLNQILRSIFQNAYFMSLIYMTVSVLVVGIIVFVVVYEKKLFISRDFFIVFTVVIVYSIFSVPSEKSSMNIASVFFYVLLPMMAGAMINIRSDIVLKTILILSSFSMLFIDKFFVVDSNGYITMGMSYIFMTPIIAASIYLYLFYKNDISKSKKLFFLFSLLQVIYFLKLFQYGSRGPLISIILCWLFMLVVKYNIQEKNIYLSKSKIGFMFVGLIIVINQFYNILVFINLQLSKHGISAQIIEKTIRLMAQNNVFNSRDNIYTSAFSHFWDHPVFGHGLSTFSTYTNINYPHNFLIQFLFDGGVFLFLLLLFVILKNIIFWYKGCTANAFCLFIFLFFISVPGALVSGDIWENERFWLFIGCLISMNYYFKKEKDIYFS